MAMGMSAFPSFMTQATPATQPLINAEPAVAAQTEQNPQVGQVMPGVQGADAPVVAQNGPSRDVKLTFAQIAPPGNDSNLLIVFYVQIMPDDFVMQLHRF